MRLAIISDIHEDHHKLQEAFRKIEKHNVDQVVCLGDISGYSVPYYNYLQTRNAHECLKLIRKNCEIIILGNHDIHAAQIIPQTSPYFPFPKNWYQLDYQERKTQADNSIWLHEENDLNPLYTKEDIAFLKTLPEFHVLKTAEFNVLFTHYAYPNINGIKKAFYTYPNEFKWHFQFMEDHGCMFSFFGHSHVKGFITSTKKQFRQYGYKKLELKPDVTCIGIPPISSNGKRSGFCIFDTVEMKVEVARFR